MLMLATRLQVANMCRMPGGRTLASCPDQTKLSSSALGGGRATQWSSSRAWHDAGECTTWAEVGALILRWLGPHDEHAAAQGDREVYRTAEAPFVRCPNATTRCSCPTASTAQWTGGSVHE